MSIPIAWLQLKREPIRFGVAVAAVALAVVLMFMEFGFQSALFDSSCLLYQKLDGGLFLVDKRSASLVSMRQFSRRRLEQALACPSVRSVSCLYCGYSPCRSQGSDSRRIFVIGISPSTNAIRDTSVRRQQERLNIPDTALFDRGSRSEFGPVSELYTQKQNPTLDINGRKLQVAGLFSLGTSFGADGNIITSDTTFMRMFPMRHPGLIDVGIIELRPKTDPSAVKAQLASYIPDDVLLLTKNELTDSEKRYWKQSTPIGFIFSLGVVLSLIVGAAVIYQIIYGDIDEHLPEYATLKAMGYSDRFLLDVVFQEAILLALIGYVPGFIGACLLYQWTRDITGLPLVMVNGRTLMVVCLSIAMCCLATALASHRLRVADPADIF